MDTTNTPKFELLKGDKVLWIVILLISIGSLFPVYSASSNLEYVVHQGTTIGHLKKHALFIIGGLVLMRLVGTIKYEFIGKLSFFFLMITFFMLIGAILTGDKIGGASASRWLKIPGTGLGLQPSAFVYLTLIIYLCRFLTKNINRKRLPIEYIFYVFVPILIVFGSIAKDNGSTALMVMITSMIVLLVGQLKLKYIVGFLGVSTVITTVVILLALKTDVLGKENRIDTWISRITTHSGTKETKINEQLAQLKTKKNKSEEEKNKEDKLKNELIKIKAKKYQSMQAKAAIVHGGITGKGPGKSVLKQVLPQSASDFIFAIIVEEYGLIGAGTLLFLYLVIMVRIVQIAHKIPSFFGTLLVLSMGMMIFLQLFVNVAVAVNIIPVTGQPLPLISYGGTAMLVTYVQLGLVLNVSSRIQIYDEEGIGRKQSIEEINDIA